MTLRTRIAAGAMALAAVAGSARAAEIELHGEYRLRALDADRYVLADDGTLSTQAGWRENRLRISPQMNFQGAKIFGQLDLFSGSVFGHKSSIGEQFVLDPNRNGAHGLVPDTVDPRHLYVEKMTPVGLFRVGQMPSDWGLGILANGGDRERPFGANRYGDIDERILFATKPLMKGGQSRFSQNFYTVAAVDLVYRDENASLVDDDRAWQGTLAAFYREYENTAGIYLAGRLQDDDTGATLRVIALDTYENWIYEGVEFRNQAAFEGVVVLGRTTRVRSDLAKSGADVRAAGYVAQGKVEYLPFHVALSLEHGFASGDNNPQDGTVTRLSFDPDHKVGMILYDEVLYNVSAYSADHVANELGATGETRSTALELGILPDSISSLPTNGGVSSSTYLFPTLVYQTPLSGLEIRGGYLLAWLTADFFDPLNTNQKGGVPASPYGIVEAERFLGQEVDLGLHYDFHLLGDIGFKFAVQYGTFLAGDAFKQAAGGTKIHKTGQDKIDKIEGRFTLKW